jgi:hypothetical protein
LPGLVVGLTSRPHHETGEHLAGISALPDLCAYCVPMIAHSDGKGSNAHGHVRLAVHILRTIEPERMTATLAFLVLVLLLQATRGKAY